MTDDASGTASPAPSDEVPARAGADDGARRLLFRPALVLPLGLIAVALGTVLLVSASLWQLGTQAMNTRAEDLDWTFAQTQIEVLRLHEAAEDLAADPSATRAFDRHHALLLNRLAQIDSGPPWQLAAGVGLDNDIAAVRRAALAVQASGRGRRGGAELAALMAGLVRLEQALAMAGSRANSAYGAVKSGRTAALHRTVLLGAPLMLAGLMGGALLGLRMLRIERRLLDNRRLELDLQRERDEASYMRNIAAIISHQMRAPLAVIDSAAQRVLRRPETAEGTDTGAAMLRIRRQVRRVMHFADQAMLAGTLEGGRAAAMPRPVAAHDLIALVVASEGVHDQRRRLVLPPAASGRLRVLCDPDLSFHALANIVENALKYSPPHSPVELRVTRSDGMAVISVSDRGRGVPGPEQDAIFERFRRGSGAGDQPGTGIGLWLARRLAEIQGGTVRVDSDGRTGARFDLCLPAVGDAATVPLARAGATPAPAQRRVAHARH